MTPEGDLSVAVLYTIKHCKNAQMNIGKFLKVSLNYPKAILEAGDAARKVCTSPQLSSCDSSRIASSMVRTREQTLAGFLRLQPTRT